MTLNKLFAALLVSLLIFSCDNNESNQENLIEVQLLTLIEDSSLEDNVLFIKSINDSNINFYVQDGWEAAWSENENLQAVTLQTATLDPGDEVCRGSGISFARCVKRVVDSGKCVKVFIDNEGDYVAQEISC